MTLPTALAAPVAEGMMFCDAQRPPRQSLPPREGPSTVSWVAVTACTVVMRPSAMPNLSFTTFASGARQFVLRRSGDDHLLAAPAKVKAGLRLVAENPCGLAHVIRTSLTPRDGSRVLLGEDGDRLAIDDEAALALLHRARVHSVDRVVLQHVD